MKPSITTLTLILLFSSPSRAQTGYKDAGALRFNLISGYHVASNDIWKTHKSLDGIVGGFELGYSKFASRNRTWHKVFGTPRLGITFQTIFMNKADTFGTCYSLLPNIGFRLYTWRNSDLTCKLSLGPTYCTKLFDNETNFDNRAVSSPINFGLEFTGVYHHIFNQHFELNLEGGFFHVSNGNSSLPNGGYNMLLAKAGINYFFNAAPYWLRKGTMLRSYGEKLYYSVHASFAYREQGTYWDKRDFAVFTLHQSVMKKLNKISALGVATDAFYDPSPKLTANPNLKLFVSDVKEAEKYHFSLGACYELRVGKLAIPLEVYSYMWNLKIIKNPLYMRFGLKYYVHRNLFFAGFLKGGMQFESSFIEMGMGWSFFRS